MEVTLCELPTTSTRPALLDTGGKATETIHTSLVNRESSRSDGAISVTEEVLSGWSWKRIPDRSGVVGSRVSLQLLCWQEFFPILSICYQNACAIGREKFKGGLLHKSWSIDDNTMSSITWGKMEWNGLDEPFFRRTFLSSQPDKHFNTTYTLGTHHLTIVVEFSAEKGWFSGSPVCFYYGAANRSNALRHAFYSISIIIVNCSKQLATEGCCRHSRPVWRFRRMLYCTATLADHPGHTDLMQIFVWWSIRNERKGLEDWWVQNSDDDFAVERR